MKVWGLTRPGHEQVMREWGLTRPGHEGVGINKTRWGIPKQILKHNVTELHRNSCPVIWTLLWQGYGVPPIKGSHCPTFVWLRLFQQGSHVVNTLKHAHVSTGGPVNSQLTQNVNTQLLSVTRVKNNCLKVSSNVLFQIFTLYSTVVFQSVSKPSTSLFHWRENMGATHE